MPFPYSLGGPPPATPIPNPYTVTNYLLPSLKRRGLIPSTAGTLSDADFIVVADEELQTYIVELLLEASEEYLVGTYDYSILGGVDTYGIPPRAVSASLRAVLISDNAGGFRRLARIEPERQEDYSVNGGVGGYKLEGNNIVLVPSPGTTSGTLRLKYEIRPNQLVADAACGQISSINTGTKQVTVTAVPATFTNSVSYDIVGGKPHFALLAMDQAATIVGSVMTFSALPTSLAVGDYICIAGQSCIPQVPNHLHSLLSQRTMVAVLDSLGDKQAVQANQKCEQMRMRALKMMVKRVPGSARIIKNRSGPGFRNRQGWRL